MLENSVYFQNFPLDALKKAEDFKLTWIYVGRGRVKTAKKTKKILVVDNGWMQYGISSEILSLISENLAKPVEIISGFFVLAHSLIKSK